MSGLENISVRQLRIFRAIVENGNLAKAAQAIGLTAPAVSTALKQIEDQIGAATLRRGRDGKIELLPIGEQVLLTAQRVDSAYANGQSSINAIQSGLSGFVRLGVVSTAKYFAPKLVHEAQARWPDIELDLFVGNRGEVVSALRNEEFDLAIMGRPPRVPPVDFIAIGKHPHIMIAPAEFHWDGDVESLKDETFLVREEGSGTRILFERYASDVLRFSYMKEKSFSSNETIKQAVMAGMGLAFISASTCQYELEHCSFKTLALPRLPIEREWYVVWRKGEVLTPATQKIREFIHENAKTAFDYQFLEKSSA